MPTTYAIDAADVIDGSQAAIGYASNRNELSDRKFVVTASDTNGTKSGAAAAVYGTYSSEPAISGIPLDHAVVAQVGPKKFIVVQRYRWQSVGHWGGSSVTTAADFRNGVEWVPCYTVGTPESDGLPATSADWFYVANAADINNPPRAYMFPVQTVKVRIPVRTNTNVMTSGICALSNKVNNASVTLLSSDGAPLTLATGQIRYDGSVITCYSNATYKWVGYHEFTVRQSFKVMSVKFNTGAWAATKTLNLATADFNTAFGI